MRRCAATLSLVIVGLSAATCVGRPTQIVLHVGSNAPPNRAAQLSILTRVGAASRDELLAFRGQITRIEDSAGAIFPGSVGLVPAAQGPRGSALTVWAVLELPSVGGQPALRVERLQRLLLIERVPQLARMFFNVACASVTTGCRQSPPERCTLSALCIERGETCGDDGVCVPQELPTQPIDQLDAGVNFDAGVVRADATTDVARADAPPVVDAGINRTPPRLIAPMSTSRVAQPRPTLRFELSDSATDAEVELCSDRAMSAGCSRFSASSGSAAVPSARPRGWSFWRVTARRMGAALAVSPVWQFYVGSGTPSTTVSTVVGKALDLNGDGRVDLAVASRNPDEVAVYNGGPTGLGDAPSVVLAAPAGASLFGRSVDAAGDINGDGFGDMVIGAPGGGPGRAFVYFGRPSGVSATPDVTLTGDIDSDEFGYAVAGAGDIDGDGYGDLVIGAPNASVAAFGAAGTARTYMGRDGAPQVGLTLIASAMGERFGAAVTGGGDLNGDGFSDVIVGAPRADVGGRRDAGEARAFLGDAMGVRVTSAASIAGLNAADMLGHSVAIIGDYNGDGAADAVAGAPSLTANGSARLGRGSIDGMLFVTPSVFALSTPARDDGGFAVSSAGDVNNDGLSDFAFTAPLANFNGTRSGLVGVCLGATSGVRSPCAGVIRDAVSGEQLGESVASVGDVNGDGFDDIVAGAPNASRGGRAATGCFRLYLGNGSAEGISLTHAREVVGTRAIQRFANALGGSTH